MADRDWKLAAVDAAASLSTTGRQHHPGYRDRMREIVEAVEPLIRTDERRKVIAELTTNALCINKAVDAIDAYVPFTPGNHAALAEAFCVAVEEAASLLAPEGERTSDSSTSSEAPKSEASPSPEHARAGDDWSERAERGVREGTAVLLRMDPNLSEERARTMAWNVLSSSLPWIRSAHEEGSIHG
jgi:hypothetical protein